MPKRYHMLHLYAKDVTLTGVFKVLGLGDADSVEAFAFCFRAGPGMRTTVGFGSVTNWQGGS